MEYALTADSLTVTGQVSAALAACADCVLPLIGEHASVEILQGKLRQPPATAFNLSPGFLAKEYRIAPDETGLFSARITVAK